MTASRRPRSRQAELFARPKRSVIEIAPTHRLVMITEETDWTELEELVQAIRRSKLKNEAGRPPHLRALIGALVFRALRKMTYRDTEDQIRHYAPARYLCGLTETDWTPDANTIQDFEQLLGEDGVKKVNEHVVKWAVEEKLADPTVVAADTTAQEAAVPYPNEMRLMATFVSAIAAASKNVGAALQGFVKRAGGLFRAAKTKLREFRLFAKTKSKAARSRLASAMAIIVQKVQRGLAAGLTGAARQAHRLTKYRKAAWSRIQHLHQTMQKLLPQIRYWIRTGFVAKNKIVSLYIPEIYAILRGKIGKPIEFGLNWGIERLRGGFLLATLAKDKLELMDSRFAVRAAKDHQALFGKAPTSYAYDRAGSSEENVAALKKLGVSHVGLAPRGKAKWRVRGRVKKRLISERAQVEGGIGAIKSGKYGFNRPAAKSAAAMGVCGQRAVLGFNLNKLMNGLAERRRVVLVG
ncbi:MAG TPA: transposase [Gemmatimonadaceae bacterium]|nr:transposase [Gemmatimonadaceae bacterium]